MFGKNIGKSLMQMYRDICREDGMAVIEVILIIVVLIALVLIFKSQLTTLIYSIFDTISTQSSQV